MFHQNGIKSFPGMENTILTKGKATKRDIPASCLICVWIFQSCNLQSESDLIVATFINIKSNVDQMCSNVDQNLIKCGHVWSTFHMPEENKQVLLIWQSFIIFDQIFINSDQCLTTVGQAWWKFGTTKVDEIDRNLSNLMKVDHCFVKCWSRFAKN